MAILETRFKAVETSTSFDNFVTIITTVQRVRVAQRAYAPTSVLRDGPYTDPNETHNSIEQKEPLHCITRVRWVLLAIVEHELKRAFDVQTYGEIAHFARDYWQRRDTRDTQQMIRNFISDLTSDFISDLTIITHIRTKLKIYTGYLRLFVIFDVLRHKICTFTTS